MQRIFVFRKCIITQNITKYLNALLLHISCGGLDSNQRPSAYEADELPTALPRDIRAGSQIRTDVSLRIMITSQAESTTVPFRQLLNQKNIEDSFLVNKTFFSVPRIPFRQISLFGNCWNRTNILSMKLSILLFGFMLFYI